MMILKKSWKIYKVTWLKKYKYKNRFYLTLRQKEKILKFMICKVLIKNNKSYKRAMKIINAIRFKMKAFNRDWIKFNILFCKFKRNRFNLIRYLLINKMILKDLKT